MTSNVPYININNNFALINGNPSESDAENFDKLT